MHLKSLMLAALGVSLGSAPVMAQTPAERTILEAFRDSLARAGDSLGLSRVEAGMVSSMRRDRANAFDHLRLGFLALRQAELGATRYYEDAASEFQTVTRMAPSWPYGWFGLGLAEFGLVQPGPARQAAADAPYAKASVALARSAIIDGRFAHKLVEEAYRARRERQPQLVTVVLVALRVAAQPRAANPMILSAVGRLEREFGEASTALGYFNSWLPLSGRQRGLALLEIARTRFVVGREDGVDPYYEGALHDDSTTVHNYRRDIAFIASGSELEAFDRTAGPARVEFLRGFWGRRDAADLHRPGERLREHYRRLYHARKTFPLYLPGRSTASLAAIEPLMDDRGLIYIRHGQPDDRVELATAGVEPNESWRFMRSEGDMVVHFVARHDPDVFRLVESLLDVAETGAVENPTTRELVSRGREALLRSRELISPVYRRDRRSSPERGRAFIVAERAMSRQSLRTATSTDSWRPRFARRLSAKVDYAVFGLDSTGARLHVAYAVPFAETRASWLGAGAEYPLRLRVSGFDESGETVVALDSTTRPVSSEVFGERWLAGTLSVPIPVGRLRVRVGIQDGDSVGTLLPLRSFEVLPPGQLGLSDLSIGVRSHPWFAEPAPNETVALLPLGLLWRTDRAELAYEISSSPGVPLQSQITLMRADDHAAVISNRRATHPAGPGRQLVRHVLELHKLKPGFYRIEVTVTDGRGGLARRSREFDIR
jgi:GWxTD domain-containing protein